MVNVRIAVVTISALLTTHKLCLGASYNLNGSVDMRTSASGEVTYQFILFLSNINPTVGEDVQLELVSPAGMRFGERVSPAGDAVQILLEGVLPEEINYSVSGLWTIEETINNGSLNQYQFSVPEILNSTGFPVVPTIVSPTNGSLVGTEFDLIYSKPSRGYGLSVVYENPALKGHLPVKQIASPGHLRLSFADVPGINGEVISSLAVANFQLMSKLLIPTALNPEANSRFDEFSLIAGNFSFSTWSKPISLTFLPEPTSLLLLAVTVICATSGRGFMRLT